MKKIIVALPIVICLSSITISDSFSKGQYDDAPNMVDVNGNRQGRWIITAAMMKYGPPWTPTQIVMEGEYKDSYRFGTWKEYHSDGSRTEWIFDTINHHLQSRRFIDSRPVAETNYLYTVRKRIEVFHFNDETWTNLVPREYILHEGVAKTYYDNGTVWIEMTWKDGRLDGPMKTYYPNGKQCEEGWWRHSGWIGGYKLYSKNGKLLQEIPDPIVVLPAGMNNTVTN